MKKALAALALSFLASAGAARAQSFSYDVNNPFNDFATLTPDDTTASNVTGGRSVEALCSAAGNVSFKLGNGKSKVFPVDTGEQSFPWSVVGVDVTGTTATCSYYNWY